VMTDTKRCGEVLGGEERCWLVRRGAGRCDEVLILCWDVRGGADRCGDVLGSVMG